MKIYKTAVLPVLYGCEAWSVTLKEDQGIVHPLETASRYGQYLQIY